MSWQGTLLDEESSLLHAVNEGYRTWCLRYQKVDQLVKGLKTESESQQPSSNVAVRVHQLRAMTVGQVEGSEDPTLMKLRDAERAIKELASLTDSHGTGARAAGAKDPEQQLAACVAGGEAGGLELGEPDIDGGLKRFADNMQALDLEVEESFQRKYNADVDLKEFEQSVLVQWQERKKESEKSTRKHAALMGMQSAMRALITRYEWRLRSPEDFAAAASAAGDHVAEEASASRPSGSAASQPDSARKDFGPAQPRLWVGGGAAPLPPKALSQRDMELAQPVDAELLSTAADMFSSTADDASTIDEGDPESVRALSELLAEGAADPKRREEILKSAHAGSAEHPYGCRACHFQGGLCWKGLACSFCHICPKPKRKSKHQRDVDKRRQERYRQVKDDLGIECLDELTKIDDSRRQIMTSSEELKRRVKDAYASEVPEEICFVRSIVSKMQSAVDMYHASVPFLLVAEGGQRSQGSKEAEPAPQSAPQPPPPPPFPPRVLLQPQMESDAPGGPGSPSELQRPGGVPREDSAADARGVAEAGARPGEEAKAEAEQQQDAFEGSYGGADDGAGEWAPGQQPLGPGGGSFRLARLLPVGEWQGLRLEGPPPAGRQAAVPGAAATADLGPVGDVTGLLTRDGRAAPVRAHLAASGAGAGVRPRAGRGL
uniref:C3H1-type domain-containing protein n=1 Tax=Alexandrium monilatum TaxID=311494 RepID=A0A7S4SGQ8_9DINO